MSNDNDLAIKELTARRLSVQAGRDANERHRAQMQNEHDLYAKAVREADERLAAIDAAIAQLEGKTVETIVVVPGQLTAHYKDGVITQWVFMPAETDAGYFGGGTYVWEGDSDLDVKDQDGPFWNAVRQSFDGENFTAKWVC